jgi:dTDP-4-amino-4,6-dideoxygalactose transaminase
VVTHTGKGVVEKSKRYVGAIADFTSFSFHAVNVFKIEGDAGFCNKALNSTGLAI